MYRFFEILPGALAWGTIILMFLFSWKLPQAVAVFIILFDIYWLLKSVYLSLHMRAAFAEMRRNLKVDWREKLREAPPARRDAFHLVIFPMYKEPYEVVRESFASAARAEGAKEKFFVVLATEAAAGEPAQAAARRIEREFKDCFFRFLATAHPAGLPGEIPGKGSNEAYAALRAKEALIDPLVAAGALSYDRVLVSAFDVDTQVPPGYFSRLAYAFATAPDPLRAIYQPIPLFTNNIFDAPSFARVVAFSATFWQMMQQARPERLTTFSSQSIPLPVLLDVGLWQRDVVSEDSRIFWQAYLRYGGGFRVEPLYYPVSMDANVAPTFWGTMKNIYRQQRRWGWGVENVPYLLDGFRRHREIPRGKKWYWTWNALEGFHSWATNALMIFALGWLPLLLGGPRFHYTLLSYSLPSVTRTIMAFSMIGVATSAVLGLLLLPPKPQWFRLRHSFLYFLEWLFIPVTLIVFGAIPGLDAQTRLMLGGKFRLGFWVTPKSRNTESSR